MANYLPPGALPKIKRLTRGGKEIGSFGCLIKGKRVNLRTVDYAEARKRAKIALETGQTDFPDSTRETAPTDGPPVNAAPMPRTPPPVGGSFADEVASAVSGVDDSTVPPPSNPPPAETPDYIPPGGEPPAEEDAAEGTTIDPDMLAEVTETVATVLVELQLFSQAWVARRWAKVQLGEVPLNHKSRKISVKCWKKALESLVPKEIPIPPWAAAIIAVGSFGLMEQAKGAKPLEEDNPPPVQQ